MADSARVCDTRKTLRTNINASVDVGLSAQAVTKGEEADPFWKKSLYTSH